MHRKSCPFTLKATDTATRTIEGHASIFNIPDDGFTPDIMQPGAFAKTIKEWGPAGANRIKILALHRSDWLPIGKPLELLEDQAGLYFKAQISDTALGNDVLTLVRDGVITELSIGYDPIRWERDTEKDIRILQEVRLWEISPVTWAMHPMALISSAKELKDLLAREPQLLDELKTLLAAPAPASATPAAGEFLSDPAVRQSLAQLRETLSQ